MSNIAEFIKETVKKAEAEEKKMKQEAVNIITGAYDRLLTGSAVDTSLYKSSHLLSVNEPLPDAPEKPSETRIRQQENQIKNLSLNNGDKISISNSLKYAEALEYQKVPYAPNENYKSIQQEPLLYARTEDEIQQILNKDVKI